jgi:hypothetical protein
MEQPRRCELVDIGSKGRIEIPNMSDDSGPIVIKIGDYERVEATPVPDRFLVQMDEFTECVLMGKAQEFPARMGCGIRSPW